ncbi:hypothetical protein BMETH_548_2 [methanotrophic bacterial endosymbiont of Bathymodiolus sp.]|nr:hypothetical protein BMETH_548_2 [methanotrophic bacterial endosymbiont of Bathymodiolus sp.]
MLEEELSLTLEERTTDAYEKLLDNMPSVGFISRKKRIKGYIEITEIAQYMITSEEITNESAFYIFSIMMRKCAKFNKAATMTALSLESLWKDVFSPIGLKFIIEVRRNLNLPSTHHSDNEATVIEEKLINDGEDQPESPA